MGRVVFVLTVLTIQWTPALAAIYQYQVHGNLICGDEPAITGTRVEFHDEKDQPATKIAEVPKESSPRGPGYFEISASRDRPFVNPLLVIYTLCGAHTVVARQFNLLLPNKYQSQGEDPTFDGYDIGVFNLEAGYNGEGHVWSWSKNKDLMRNQAIGSMAGAGAGTVGSADPEQEYSIQAGLNSPNVYSIGQQSQVPSSSAYVTQISPSNPTGLGYVSTQAQGQATFGVSPSNSPSAMVNQPTQTGSGPMFQTQISPSMPPSQLQTGFSSMGTPGPVMPSASISLSAGQSVSGSTGSTSPGQSPFGSTGSLSSGSTTQSAGGPFANTNPSQAGRGPWFNTQGSAGNPPSTDPATQIQPGAVGGVWNTGGRTYADVVAGRPGTGAMSQVSAW